MSQAENLPQTNNELGAALDAAMNGVSSPSVGERAAPEAFESDALPKSTTDLEALADKEAAGAESTETQTGADQTQPGSEEAPSEFPEVELKVKGHAEPIKVRLDPNDPKLAEVLNKGHRFEKVMQQTAQQRKDLEAKLSQFQDYEQKAEIADAVAQAKQFMEDGYGDHALRVLLGQSADTFLETMLEERIAYQNASPEDRLKIDIERQKKGEQLRRKQDEDRIAKLEAQINGRSEQAREAEFSGYVEDAKSRYDLSQWIEDGDTAGNLNELVNAAAMADVIKLQRQRELKGENDITQRDIRRAYAQHAKRVIDSFKRQTNEAATETVAQQAKVATRNAQVASTRNYGSNDPLADFQKNGGSMSDLVDAMRRGGKGAI